MNIPTAGQWSEFIQRLIELETEAHSLGLHATAQALNNAKNVAGYERAYQIERLLAS